MSTTKLIDSKGRLLLGSEFAGATFLMETQKDGSILLRPALTVPAEIAWFFKNKEAQRLVEIGLQEAREGKFVELDWRANQAFVDQLEDEE